ncbi:ABC-type antimicrobial peptide transport system, ATPase component [Weissella oryzae SG25]|uniref:ABC-type antimicrobial peptide transport system, ATPase component n=1 Tax=Weissella oryzae (strain DSM 25784 / JCM 18191 / LMG 30913 / SG25) TaxID=1329250 RepID=A0A069CT01_WEIOS|nr:ABC transporter ATP-binding protein [Weissella oryzae]GAK30532.1 ABC-type antimicrobial peptide transport system, ATPase component [Weissella oryzae SG25]
MTLTVKNLSHWYTNPDEALYRDVNLTFEDGKFYAIVGESGSGKTTLLSFLAGLDLPATGEIAVNGKAIEQIGLTAYRRHEVSTIFQAYNLLTTMSAYQNLATALAITQSSRAKDKAYIFDVLAQVGIDEQKAVKSVQKLSGGEQQRVAIARSLAVDAPIVLADEATGNLDHDNSLKIIELFQNLAHQHGKTVILITHDQALALKADKKILLEKQRFTQVKA